MLNRERRFRLEQLQDRLQYEFSKLELLDRSLTHKSYADRHQQAGILHYGSLEFLGDAILGFVIAAELFRRFPTLSQGQLSKLRSHLVSGRQLEQLSIGLGLGGYLLLGKGEEKTGGRTKRALLADVFESLVAAIYLDGGLLASKSFILSQFAALLSDLRPAVRDYKDSKSRLQELLHARGLAAPVYRLIDESGPDHKKRFQVEVTVSGRVMGSGKAGSKKAAQQVAAAQALTCLEDSFESFSDVVRNSG